MARMGTYVDMDEYGRIATTPSGTAGSGRVVEPYRTPRRR